MKINSLLLASIFALLMLATPQTTKSQSYLVGPVDPNVGTSANYTTHNHFNLFNVLNPTGVYLDSITIYPSTAATSYTIQVQNSASVMIASYTGVTTVGGNLPERIKANIFVPFGTGYRLGLTTGSVGMLRNSTGILYPYTVPNVITFTGSTFQTTYWYFFYNIRVTLPATATDAGIFAITNPGDSVCAGSQPVQVTLKNWGPSDLTSATIHWSVNNVAQTPLAWSGNIPLNGTANVTLGNYTFATGTTYAIKAYTHEPNTQNDTVNTNDTLVKTGIIVKILPSATFNVSDTNLCAGDTLLISGALTGTPPWTLVVSNGTVQQTFPNITIPMYAAPLVPPATATYTLVSVADASGCTAYPGTAHTVNVVPAPPASINPTTSPSFCEGDSVVLMATIGSGFTYEWFKDGVLIPNATNFVYIAKISGSYEVRIYGPTGCSAISAPIMVNVHPNPVVALGNDTAVYPGTIVTLNAGTGFAHYFWSTGDTTQHISVDTAGYGIGIRTIWVEVTDVNGCTGRDTIMINFNPNPGMAETYHETIRLHPNPTTGLVTLTFPFNSSCLAEVFSMAGQKVHAEVLKGNSSALHHTLNLKHLPDGLYLLSVSSGDHRYRARLVIEK